MRQSKLLKVLSVLEDDELKSFKKFILHYTTKGSDNYTLIDKFSKTKVDLQSLDPTEFKNKFFDKLTDKGFSNLQSKVYLWLEEFLALEEMKSNRHEKELYLIKAFNKKGLYNFADQLSQKVSQELKTENSLDLVHAKTNYNILRAQFYSANPIKYSKNSSLLNDLVDHFLIHVKENLSFLQLELINWGKIINNEFSDLHMMIDTITSEINSTALTESLGHTRVMIENLDLDSFKKIRQQFFDDKFKHGSELQIVIATYLRRTVNKLWNKGKIQNPQIVVDVLNQVLEIETTFSKGNLNPISFHNAVDFSAAFLGYEKTNNFIDKWSNKIKSGDNDSTYKLAQAINAFKNEKYKDLLVLLRGQVYDNYFQKIRGLGLYAIALYTQKEDELLAVHNSNFIRFLNRHKDNMSENLYHANRNMLKILEDLNKRKYEKSLKINLEDYNPVIYRSWLTTQI